jgi:hypothetical protein
MRPTAAVTNGTHTVVLTIKSSSAGAPRPSSRADQPGVPAWLAAHPLCPLPSSGSAAPPTMLSFVTRLTLHRKHHDGGSTSMAEIRRWLRLTGSSSDSLSAWEVCGEVHLPPADSVACGDLDGLSLSDRDCLRAPLPSGTQRARPERWRNQARLRRRPGADCNGRQGHKIHQVSRASRRTVHLYCAGWGGRPGGWITPAGASLRDRRESPSVRTVGHRRRGTNGSDRRRSAYRSVVPLRRGFRDWFPRTGCGQRPARPRR